MTLGTEFIIPDDGSVVICRYVLIDFQDKLVISKSEVSSIYSKIYTKKFLLQTLLRKKKSVNV